MTNKRPHKLSKCGYILSFIIFLRTPAISSKRAAFAATKAKSRVSAKTFVICYFRAAQEQRKQRDLWPRTTLHGATARE